MELQLALATTVHKAQGGEYPCVVVPLHHAMPRKYTHPKQASRITSLPDE